MKRCVAALPLALLLGIVLLGCEPPKPTSSAPASPPLPPGMPPPAPPAEAAPAAPAPAPLPPETKFGVFAGDVNDLAARPSSPASPPPAPPAAPSAGESGTERVKAEKGVGLKGRSLDQYEGIVVTPAKAFFSAKERIAFEIQVPHALQLYEATNGEGPKTHDDFMRDIIQANQIKLPILPPGAKYVYDPATKQLMVERPKRQ
jgi:hypothetical protein